MVATLSHSPKPVVENFYENSFKQLSAVQQRQVGLIVGAAVADAAARSLEGYTQEEIAMLEAEQTSGSATPTRPERSPLVFTEEPMRGYTNLSPSQPQSPNPLMDHSFSYQFYCEMVRTIGLARGDFPIEDIKPRWIEAAMGVCPTTVFNAEHGSLLHTLPALLAVPAIYPYASDDALRHFARPFAALLTELPGSDAAAPTDELLAEQAAVQDFTLSALGVVLRCLQTNPDPVRNAALMALPDCAPIFPEESACFCPSGPNAERLALNAGYLKSYQAASATSSARPLPRPVLHDAQIVREGLTIYRTSPSFAHGVVRAIRLGGPVCQRAMLVGALMGATHGARHIPLPWLSATVDHKKMSTIAIDIAQWTWNPPHH